MTKCWLILPFFMAGLLGDKALADCVPAQDTPASVIEYFQKLNKPLPEKFCAKEAPPQASHQPPRDSSEAPHRYGDHDAGASPFSQYEGDPGDGYQSDEGGGYEREQGGDYERDHEGEYQRGGGYERDQERGYERGGGYEDEEEDDQDEGYERDQEGGYERGYEGDQRGGYERERWGDYESDHHGALNHDGDDYWKNDDKDHKGGKHKHGKRHGKRKSACKEAHMKWNKSTQTCFKRG